MHVNISHYTFHYSLPQYLNDQVEKIQKRALKIIFPGVDYAECLSNAKLTTLYERRTVCTFLNMMLPTHKRNAFVKFVPPPKKKLQIYDLRIYPNLLVPRCRTEHFPNCFIPAAARVYIYIY